MEILITILAHLPFALGLFFTAKHMDNPLWYFSFIPVLQIVLFFKLAGYNTIMMILLFILTIFGMAAGFGEIAVYLLFYMLTFQIGSKSGFGSGKSLVVALIPVLGLLIIGLYHYFNTKNKIKNKEKERVNRVNKLKEERNSQSKSSVIDEILSINCDKCNKTLKVKKLLAIKAKKGKCPNCENIINLV